MDAKNTPRARVEALPQLLVLWFILIGFSLAFANYGTWELLDNIVSSFVHARAPYVEILVAILTGITVYSALVFAVGLKRPTVFLHPANVILPPIFIILLELILYVFTIVDFRIRLDFIWFTFGDWSGVVYLLSIAFLATIIVVLIAGFVPFWKAEWHSEKVWRQLPPRITAVVLVITVGIALPEYLDILFYFPWTFDFWTNMAGMYVRYVENAGLYLAVTAVVSCVFIFLAWYARKAGFRGNVRLVTLVLGFSIATGIMVFMLAALVNDLQASLQSALPGLESSVQYPFVVIMTILALLELKAAGVLAKLRMALNSRKRHKTVAIMLHISGQKAFGLTFTIIFVASMFYLTPLVTAPPVVDVQSSFELQQVNGITEPFESGVIYPNFELQPGIADGGTRDYINLTGSWKFSFTPGISDLSFYPRTPATVSKLGSGFQETSFDDSKWMNQIVPSSINRLDNPDASFRGVQGVCWYRTWFSSPSLQPGSENQTVMLKCLGSNYFTDIWVDGNYAGFHEGGFTSFAIDVTNFLATNTTEHLLAIRVDSVGFKTAYYARIVPGYADWFNYAGIIRDIYIEISPRVHVVRADVLATSIQPSAGSSWMGHATIEVNVSIETSIIVPSVAAHIALYPLSFPNTTALMDEDTWRYVNDSSPTLTITSGSLSCDFPTTSTAGMPFAACTIAFSADNLSLWTNKQPSLYALQVNLSSSAVPGVLDRFITQVGFRSFNIVDSKFELNGAPVYLAGTSIHEEWENSGRTLTTAQIFTDLSLMKNLSCNIFRSHYPMNPVYYLYADRLGLSAWQECPDYWFNEVNFIEADISNSTWAMFLEMVYRDFNRPSIFFQGVTNEPISEKLLVSYLQERKALLAFVDPSRILGFAGASNYLENPGWAVTDIVGFNCYWGLEEGVLGDYYNQARSAMATVAKVNPGKPILITEFSPGNNTSNTMVQPFEDYVKAFEENPAICGILYWVFADYVGYSGSTQSTGVYSFDRTQERPTGPVMQALYTNLTAANP